MNGVAATQTKKLAPSVLELGADNLTRNPRAEALGRLFSRPSSNVLASVESFLTVAKAGSEAARTTAAASKSAAKDQKPQTRNNLANDLFVKRETSAEARLKELLNPAASSSSSGAAQQGGAAAAGNPAPQITRNSILRVQEGGSATLTSLRLSSTDAGTAKQDIVYTVDETPSHGRLERVSKPGQEITRFTQSDLESGAVRYVHDGSETSGDKFNFTVSDGTSETSGSFAIAVSSVNDAPEVSVNAGITVDEGDAATISTAALSAFDPDTLAANTVFEVVTGPQSGRLESTDDPGTEITSFTQADLQAGRVRYVNDGSESTSDSFTFAVSDGAASTSVQTFNIGINAVDDAPKADANTGGAVSEGGTSTITAAQLNTVDVDTAPEDITYTVTSGPTNGRLEKADNAGTAITSFTQADINAGLVRFVHDGSETTDDSFSFAVSDGTTTLAGDTFNFSVTAVDDPPVIAANTGLTVSEGGTGAITSAKLNTTDADTAPEDITYTVTSAPANGRLERTDNPGTAITSFTQADINAGLVRFVHDGSETTDDSFSFAVSDGTTTLAGDTFNFSVTAVDDPPVIAANTGLTVSEGGTGAITSAKLNTTDADTAPEDITYTVTSAPANGRLERTDNPGTEITSFTQADINAGLVQFVHDVSETTNDSFTFAVSDGTTTLSSVSFGITITPVNDAPVAGANTGTTVNEGGTGTITAAQLNTTDADTDAANITYTVTSAPTHGRLEKADNAGVAVTSFTQADIDAGNLRYVHDGSETTSDSFTFGVTDGATALAPATFNIGVTPVDDAPTLGNNGGTVTEGGSVTLNTTNLSATDVDTSSSNLVYTVTSTPTGGRLERVGSPGAAITSFTQADIDAGNLRYVHDGSETTSDSFTFGVTDGATALAPATFNIGVTPVDDAPTLGNNGGTVTEGGSVTLNTTNLSATDVDTSSSNLVYTVTSAPTGGRLERVGSPGAAITGFTQADITSGQIRFVHAGGEAPTSSFGFSLSDGTNTLSGKTFNFNVTPVNDAPVLATNAGVTVARGNSVIINSSRLNTTDADTAKANLTYTVNRATTRGRLELTTNPGVSVNSFTQGDIDAGRLRYVHTRPFSGTDDSFRFRVSDGATQLGNATFNITVT